MLHSQKGRSMPKNALLLKNPGMVFVVTFVVLVVVNALGITVANILFPGSVVLGTITIPYTAAILLSAGVLAWINTLVLPFVSEYERRRGRELSPMEMMGLYLGINFVGLWLISRVAEIFGLGFSSWIVVLLVALVLDMLQGAAMVQVEKMRKK